jgi:hypothetical protein
MAGRLTRCVPARAVPGRRTSAAARERRGRPLQTLELGDQRPQLLDPRVEFLRMRSTTPSRGRQHRTQPLAESAAAPASAIGSDRPRPAHPTEGGIRARRNAGSRGRKGSGPVPLGRRWCSWTLDPRRIGTREVRTSWRWMRSAVCSTAIARSLVTGWSASATRSKRSRRRRSLPL